MEGRGAGEAGRRDREGDGIGMGAGCKVPGCKVPRGPSGQGRGVATSSSSAMAPSTPRNEWMKACGGRAVSSGLSEPERSREGSL